jgi:hypothetical protein
MTGHVHQWKRWPVTDFTLRYTCVVCGDPESIVWVEASCAGKSIADIDALLVEKYGGVFAGEMVPQPKAPS